MVDKIVVEGLTPVEAVKKGKNYEAKVWNRTYTIGENPFFSSILTGGDEVLAGPMRLVGRQNEKDIVWKNFSNFNMVDESERYQTFCQTAESGLLFLNTAIKVYYDGAVKCTVKITPTGLRPEVPKYTEENIILDKLWLEVPIKKEFAKMYHVYPQYEPILLDGVPSAKGWTMQAFKSMDFLPEKSIATKFKHSFYVGNDHAGVSLFFEDDKGWTPADENHVMELFIKDDEVLLRIHFLDSEHEYWRKKCEWKGFLLYPIKFEFGMQATPVKPFPKNPFAETNYHDHGAIHGLNGEVYETLLLPPLANFSTPTENPSSYEIEYDKSENAELLIDRLKRCGVNTVYVHERWNDMQNSVLLTKETAERLKRMVKAAHDRDMKLIPYFGFEMSELSPLAENLQDYQVIGVDENYCGSQWNRRPFQKDYRICYKSDFARIWLDGLAKIIDTYHIDGLYLDGTFSPRACKNESHGCGYRDSQGKLHSTYPIWALREVLEELYDIVHTRGGVINAHTSNSFAVPTLAFADTLWDGEPIQGYLRSGKVEEMPEGHIRSMYAGRNTGVPAFMICVNNENWTFHNACTCVIPYGLLPKPQTIEGLDEMAKVWKVYKSVPMEDATFKAYYENDVTVSNSSVKVSYFDYDGAILAVVANMKKGASGKTEVVFNGKFKSAVNRITDEKLNLIDGNKIIVEYDDFDYSLIELKK